MLTRRFLCYIPRIIHWAPAVLWFVVVCWISSTSFLSSSWWRHQMETFSASLVICAGNSSVPSEFPAQRPVTWMFSLICVWINGWIDNHEAGDLRRYRAHYDVTVETLQAIFGVRYGNLSRVIHPLLLLQICNSHHWLRYWRLIGVII